MQCTARFREALIFAAQLHAAQFRKGTEIPYAAHLLGVCSLVLEYGGDEDEAVAALLHDAVEDQGGPEARSRIRTLFGERVAQIVEGCTDHAKGVEKPPWRRRKEAYIAHLAKAPPPTLLVSCCDKLHNARAIVRDLRLSGPSVWERFSGGREGVLWYYAALSRSYALTGPAPVAEELGRTVREMQILAKEEVKS
jgi:(p)ppGpp synthase/HD superfamily hydrolase